MSRVEDKLMNLSGDFKLAAIARRMGWSRQRLYLRLLRGLRGEDLLGMLSVVRLMRMELEEVERGLEGRAKEEGLKVKIGRVK